MNAETKEVAKSEKYTATVNLIHPERKVKEGNLYIVYENEVADGTSPIPSTLSDQPLLMNDGDKIQFKLAADLRGGYMGEIVFCPFHNDQKHQGHYFGTSPEDATYTINGIGAWGLIEGTDFRFRVVLNPTYKVAPGKSKPPPIAVDPSGEIRVRN